MGKRGSWIAALMLIVLLVSGCSSGSQDKSAGGAAVVEPQATSADQASNKTDGGEAEAKSETAVTSKTSQRRGAGIGGCPASEYAIVCPGFRHWL